MAQDLVGLKQEAEDFLKQNVENPDSTVIDTYGEDFDLYKYDLKDGSNVTERIQHIDKKTGSIYLYLIADDNRQLFAWTDEEISNA